MIMCHILFINFYLLLSNSNKHFLFEVWFLTASEKWCTQIILQRKQTMKWKQRYVPPVSDVDVQESYCFFNIELKIPYQQFFYFPQFHQHIFHQHIMSFLTDITQKGFSQRLTTLHGTGWSTKGFWYSQPWYFLTKTVCYWFFWSYITNGTFLVDLQNKFSEPAFFSSGLRKRSLPGPLLFSIYINMSQAVQCNFFLKSNGTSLDGYCIMITLWEHSCDWFVVNKSSIHFGDDKTKSFFDTKFEIKIGNYIWKMGLYRSNSILKLNI